MEVDWQLPQQQQAVQFEMPEIPEEEPPPKEFKEKRIENLDGERGSGAFKKRKIGSGSRRNVRQRFDDD